jgi:hypothetical protein
MKIGINKIIQYKHLKHRKYVMKFVYQLIQTSQYQIE